MRLYDYTNLRAGNVTDLFVAHQNHAALSVSCDKIGLLTCKSEHSDQFGNSIKNSRITSLKMYLQVSVSTKLCRQASKLANERLTLPKFVGSVLFEDLKKLYWKLKLT